MRAVLDRAGVASSSSSEVVPYPKLEPLGAEQVQLVERIGEHVEYLSRTDEGEMAEAFLGVD